MTKQNKKDLDLDLRLFNDIAISFNEYRLCVMRIDKRYPSELKKIHNKLLIRLSIRLKVPILPVNIKKKKKNRER